MKKIVAIAILLLMLPVCSFAQTEDEDSEFTTLTLNKYDFSISVPKDSEVKDETPTMFVFGNDQLEVTIYVEDRTTISDAELGEKIVDFAKQNIDMKTADGTFLCGASLSGAALTGKMENGNGAIFAAFVGINTLRAFAITIVYADGNQDIATTILNSIALLPKEDEDVK